jgi:hypothetical protein
MRCLTCGTEMSLEQITGDDTAPVSGFERRTFVCSVCGDTEQRLAFVKQVELGVTDPVPMDATPSVENEDAAARSASRRFFSAIYGALQRGLSFVRQGKAPSSPAPAITAAQSLAEARPSLEPAHSNIEPAVVQAEGPSLIIEESDDDIDECEVLLKRAIEIVQLPVRPHEPPGSDLATKPGAFPASTNMPEPEVEAPPLSSDCSEAVAEALVALTSAPEKEVAMPAQAEAAPPEQPSATPVVVEIHYDPGKARYIAKDIKTGLSILRTADHERLRHMCDQLGWQVITTVPDMTDRQR